MADIAVSAVITKAVDIAANLVIEEGSLLYWLPEEINWIQTEMGNIQSYLADADAKQGGNEGIRNFINNIRDLAYDIEDIMDAFSPWITMRNSRRGFNGVLKTATCIFYDGCIAHCLEMKIKKIRKRLGDFNTAKTFYGINESSTSSSTADTQDARQTPSHIEEPNIVGFEEHIENLRHILLSTNLNHCVKSIVGMPGLGKTTLARKVYNSIKSNFECSAWICVSQDPNVKNLLREVARQVGLGKEEWEQNVEFNLYEFLKRKRYVIVVDDIWDQNAWDALKVGIPTDFENGSRIIITSRNNNVGRYIGGDSSLHKLCPLNPKYSWKLFSRLVSRESQSTGLEEAVSTVALSGLNRPGLNLSRYQNLSGLNLSGLNLSGYKNLHELRLEGFVIGKLPKTDQLPQNLTKLVLKYCQLVEDPLEHLKNLPKLKFLKLGFESYEGRKMMCCGGFPQLHVLDLHSLYNLEELSVEGGGMPKLNELRVQQCHDLRKMPNRLWWRIKNGK